MKCKECKKELKAIFENIYLFEYSFQIKCDNCGSLNDEKEIRNEQKNMS